MKSFIYIYLAVFVFGCGGIIPDKLEIATPDITKAAKELQTAMQNVDPLKFGELMHKNDDLRNLVENLQSRLARYQNLPAVVILPNTQVLLKFVRFRRAIQWSSWLDEEKTVLFSNLLEQENDPNVWSALGTAQHPTLNQIDLAPRLSTPGIHKIFVKVIPHLTEQQTRDNDTEWFLEWEISYVSDTGVQKAIAAGRVDHNVDQSQPIFQLEAQSNVH